MIKGINVIGYIRQVLLLTLAAFLAGAIIALWFMPILIMIASTNTPITMEEGLNMFMQVTIAIVFIIGWIEIENGALEYNSLMKLEDNWQEAKSKTTSKIRKWMRRRKFKRIK